jgi:hypothetical protein
MAPSYVVFFRSLVFLQSILFFSQLVQCASSLGQLQDYLIITNAGSSQADIDHLIDSLPKNPSGRRDASTDDSESNRALGYSDIGIFAYVAQLDAEAAAKVAQNPIVHWVMPAEEQPSNATMVSMSARADSAPSGMLEKRAPTARRQPKGVLRPIRLASQNRPPRHLQSLSRVEWFNDRGSSSDGRGYYYEHSAGMEIFIYVVDTGVNQHPVRIHLCPIPIDQDPNEANSSIRIS